MNSKEVKKSEKKSSKSLVTGKNGRESFVDLLPPWVPCDPMFTSPGSSRSPPLGFLFFAVKVQFIVSPSMFFIEIPDKQKASLVKRMVATQKNKVKKEEEGLQVLGIRCALYNLLPLRGKWSNTAIRRFVDLLFQKGIVVFLTLIKKSGPGLEVDLTVHYHDRYRREVPSVRDVIMRYGSFEPLAGPSTSSN